MSTEFDQWLAQTTEVALEPELPICDPHHHLWNWTASRHPTEQYLLDVLLADTGSGQNVVKTVFIECGAGYRTAGPEALQPVGETECVEQIAVESEQWPANSARIAGIVSHADLMLGEAVLPVLEAHLEASPNRFRGIRHIVAWDASGLQANRTFPPPGLLLDPTFREGFACLQGYGLSFEAWLYHAQLPDLIDLAQTFPETTIILNHIGGPIGTGPYAAYRSYVYQSWQHTIAGLAACPNVVVKLGGLGMPVCGLTGTSGQSRPGRPNWRRRWRRTIWPASSNLAWIAVCLKAISRLIRSPILIPCCGMRSNEWSRIFPRHKRRTSFTIPLCESIE
jgi:predicted TIM-barrel fold metal-dependent hydrolase